MDTETELRERTQSEKNETPSIDEGGDGDGGGSVAGQIPTPSVDRKVLLAVGVIAAAIIAWKLYQRQQGGGGAESLNSARENLDAEATIEDGEEKELSVPDGSWSDKDSAVTEQFRKRGVISGED